MNKGKIKCFFGIHDHENIGMGYGGLFTHGQRLQTEARLYRCRRCGKESGQVKCPQLINWGFINISADEVRMTSRFKEFEIRKDGGE